MFCIMSDALGNGWIGRFIYLLRYEKSVTRRNLPLFFGTKKAGLTQSDVLSCTSSIISSFIN